MVNSMNKLIIILILSMGFSSEVSNNIIQDNYYLELIGGRANGEHFLRIDEQGLTAFNYSYGRIFIPNDKLDFNKFKEIQSFITQYDGFIGYEVKEKTPTFCDRVIIRKAFYRDFVLIRDCSFSDVKLNKLKRLANSLIPKHKRSKYAFPVND